MLFVRVFKKRHIDVRLSLAIFFRRVDRSTPFTSEVRAPTSHSDPSRSLPLPTNAMTSSDDDYGQATANNAGNRRMNSNSNHPYPSASGIEVRLLMTSRDAGAVIGTCALHTSPHVEPSLCFF